MCCGILNIVNSLVNMLKKILFSSLLLASLVFPKEIFALTDSDIRPTPIIDTELWRSTGPHIYNLNPGNIGIGTSYPLYKLEIVGSDSSYPFSIKSSGKFIRAGALNSYYAYFDTDTNNGFYFSDPVTAGNGNVFLSNTSSNSYIINNLGINTTAPSQKLEVNGNAIISGANNLFLGDTNNSIQRIYYGDIGPYLSLRGYAGFAFFQSRNNSVALMVNSAGNLGVGASAIPHRLTVVGDGSLSNGNHPVASFTKSGTSGVYVGYKANGSTATSGLIFTDNQLPLAFGSSNGTDYLTIKNETTEINGGVRFNPNLQQVTKPGCTSLTRGLLWFTAGIGASGPQVKDTLQVCAQDQNGSTSWRTVY